MGGASCVEEGPVDREAWSRQRAYPYPSLQLECRLTRELPADTVIQEH